MPDSMRNFSAASLDPSKSNEHWYGKPRQFITSGYFCIKHTKNATFATYTKIFSWERLKDIERSKTHLFLKSMFRHLLSEIIDKMLVFVGQI